MINPTNTSTPMPVELTARGGALLELVSDPNSLLVATLIVSL